MEDRRKTTPEIDALRHELQDHYDKDVVEFQQIHKKLDAILLQLKPLTEIYEGSRFTWGTVTTILKLLAMIGAAIGAIVYIKSLFK